MDTQDITPFIVGGIAVGVSSLLLKYFDAKTAAIFYAYPIMFVLTVAFMYKNAPLTKEYSKHAIPAAVSMLVLITMYYLMSDENVLLSLLKVSGLWIITTYLIFKLFEVFM